MYIEAADDITVTLECTLYEFYNGCQKKVEYDREVMLLDKISTRTEREEMTINVKPGFS